MRIELSHRGRSAYKIIFFAVFVFITAVFVVTAVLILSRFKSVFAAKASHAAKIRAVNVLNNAIDEALSGINSEEFVNIKTDENGAVTSVSADTAQMNRLRTRVLSAAEKIAENSDDAVVYIPVGSLTNYPVLQGMGYRIPVHIVIDGFTKVDFNDEFESCGINQVRHKIFLDASAEFSVISAAMTTSDTVSLKIPVSETVIAGSVPTYYGSGFSVMGR